MKVFCIKDVVMNNRTVFTKGNYYIVWEERFINNFFNDNGHSGTILVTKNDFNERHTIDHKEGLYKTNSFFNVHFSSSPISKEVVLANENFY